MQIKQFTESDAARWDAYVEKHPTSTFFHRCGWKRVIEESVGHKGYFLYAEDNNEIVGLLPLANVRSILFGNQLTSVPFCVYGGVIADNTEIQEALVEHACNLAKDLKVDHLELRHLTPVKSDWPTKELYVTFRKELDPDHDVNMKAIPRKQRAMVRKGIKAGLVGVIDDNIERFFDTYSENVWRLGTPVFPKKFFAKLREVFGKDCEVLTVEKDGEVVATVMSFYFKNEVLPYYGGGKLSARKLAGYDFMYWDLMTRAVDRGIEIYDFGRSKNGTGSFAFKKNWGFEAQPLAYEFFLVNAKEMPDINPLNPKFQMMTKVWQKLPLGLTRVIGPMVARNLG